jgi:hypothetical protein
MAGWVDDGYCAVADTFTENFSLFPELGAAVTVYAGGRKVVELWDGSAAPGRASGGQFALADDTHGIAFAYVANRMVGHGDARATRLMQALRTSFG